jgi:hypothetical protein
MRAIALAVLMMLAATPQPPRSSRSPACSPIPACPVRRRAD